MVSTESAPRLPEAQPAAGDRRARLSGYLRDRLYFAPLRVFHLPLRTELTRSRERSEANTYQLPRLSRVAAEASGQRRFWSLFEYQVLGFSRGLWEIRVR